jgi:hypothetical protein
MSLRKLLGDFVSDVGPVSGRDECEATTVGEIHWGEAERISTFDGGKACPLRRERVCDSEPDAEGESMNADDYRGAAHRLKGDRTQGAHWLYGAVRLDRIVVGLSLVFHQALLRRS